MAFRASMTKGGDVANNVISRIATGRSGAGDVMSGNMAADALMSYMGYTALGEGAADMTVPRIWRSSATTFWQCPEVCGHG